MGYTAIQTSMVKSRLASRGHSRSRRKAGFGDVPAGRHGIPARGQIPSVAFNGLQLQRADPYCSNPCHPRKHIVDLIRLGEGIP